MYHFSCNLKALGKLLYNIFTHFTLEKNIIAWITGKNLGMPVK